MPAVAAVLLLAAVPVLALLPLPARAGEPLSLLEEGGNTRTIAVPPVPDRETGRHQPATALEMRPLEWDRDMVGLADGSGHGDVSGLWTGAGRGEIIAALGRPSFSASPAIRTLGSWLLLVKSRFPPAETGNDGAAQSLSARRMLRAAGYGSIRAAAAFGDTVPGDGEATAVMALLDLAAGRPAPDACRRMDDSALSLRGHTWTAMRLYCQLLREDRSGAMLLAELLAAATGLPDDLFFLVAPPAGPALPADGSMDALFAAGQPAVSALALGQGFRPRTTLAGSLDPLSLRLVTLASRERTDNLPFLRRALLLGMVSRDDLAGLAGRPGLPDPFRYLAAILAEPAPERRAGMVFSGGADGAGLFTRTGPDPAWPELWPTLAVMFAPEARTFLRTGVDIPAARRRLAILATLAGGLKPEPEPVNQPPPGLSGTPAPPAGPWPTLPDGGPELPEEPQPALPGGEQGPFFLFLSGHAVPERELKAWTDNLSPGRAAWARAILAGLREEPAPPIATPPIAAPPIAAPPSGTGLFPDDVPAAIPAGGRTGQALALLHIMDGPGGGVPAASRLPALTAILATLVRMEMVGEAVRLAAEAAITGRLWEDDVPAS